MMTRLLSDCKAFEIAEDGQETDRTSVAARAGKIKAGPRCGAAVRTNLLGRHPEGYRSQVHLLVRLDTGEDKENP